MQGLADGVVGSERGGGGAADLVGGRSSMPGDGGGVGFGVPGQQLEQGGAATGGDEYRLGFRERDFLGEAGRVIGCRRVLHAATGLGATIYFADEAAVHSDYHAGTTGALSCARRSLAKIILRNARRY